MRDNLMKQLKALVYDYVEDGVLLNEPKYRFVRRDFTSKQLKLLRNIVKLLIETDFVSMETKYYLANRFITLKGVSDYLKEKGHKNVTETIVRGKVWYDKKRIIKLLGDKFIIDIMEYNKNIGKYIKIVENKLSESSLYKKFCDNLVIKLPETDWNYEITDEEFNELLQYITPYIKPHINFIESNIPKESVGYIKYILSSDSLNEVDLQRKKFILDLIGYIE